MKYLFCFVGVLAAQILVDVSLQAQDKIYLRRVEAPVVGTVEKVDEASVLLGLNGGYTTIQRTNIRAVEISKPITLTAGFKAMEEGKIKEAIQILEPIYTKYRGLSEPWIEEISVHLGESYLTAREWGKAKNLFVEFFKFYPSSVFRDLAISGEGKALYSLNQKEDAARLLEGLLVEPEKEISVSDEQNRALGKACVTLGHCYLDAKKNEQALEAFLKTMTLYYLDRDAVAEAQYESALLFGKLNDPIRARDQLEDLIKEFPTSPFAVEAKEKLNSFESSSSTP